MFNIGTHKSEKKVSGAGREAFAELYEQFMPKVYRYVTFRIRDEHMAQDLTAAIFEKAFAKFDGFNPKKPPSPPGYLPSPATPSSTITGFTGNMRT